MSLSPETGVPALLERVARSVADLDRYTAARDASRAPSHRRNAAAASAAVRPDLRHQKVGTP
eukprot:1695596-Prymnesium_polylepis.1